MAADSNSSLITQSSSLKKGGRALNEATVRILHVFATTGRCTRRQLRQLGFTSADVDTAIDTLLRQGRVIRTAKAEYEYADARKSTYKAPLEDRIWTAMRINPSWACSDIARQAGTSITYVYKRLREYRAEEFVRRAGQRPVPGGAERLWRLAEKGRERITRPVLGTFEPDPLILLVTRLNKLVATGMAARYQDARDEAVRICSEITRALSATSGGPE